MNPSTPQRIIYIVVCTAAAMSVAFIVALIVLAFLKPSGSIDDKIFSALVTAGSSTLSFLFGVLVNTRSQIAPNETSQTIESTTITTAPPKP